MIIFCRLLTATTLFALPLTTGLEPAYFAITGRAYEARDFDAAFCEWCVLATGGDTADQIAPAGMYRGGIGNNVDIVSATQWYARAARSRDVITQLNLGALHH